MPSVATSAALIGPDPAETLTIRSKDGTSLFVRVWAPPSPMRAMVAIVHGYAEHGARYAATALRLQKEGYGAIALDVRGHGNSAGQRGACLRFEEFLDDADAFLKVAAERAQGKPLLLLGHSHGALISLRRLLAGALPVPPVSIAGCAVTSPFLGVAIPVAPLKLAAGRLISRLIPSVSLANEIDPGLVSHDAEVVAHYAKDPQVFKTANARWFTEASAAQAYVLSHARELKVPVLVVQGGDDQIASVASTRAFVQAAGDRVRYVELPGFYHEVLNETGREQAFAEILRSFGEWSPAG